MYIAAEWNGRYCIDTTQIVHSIMNFNVKCATYKPGKPQMWVMTISVDTDSDVDV